MSRIEVVIAATIRNDKDDLQEIIDGVICFVKDSNDAEEVERIALKAIDDYMKNSENVVLYGSFAVYIKEEEVITATFTNSLIGENVEVLGGRLH
jgi:hypothetical protein